MKRSLLPLVIFSLLFVFLALSGCSEQSLDVSKLEPKELVEVYYRSVATGDIGTARACLSAELAKKLGEKPDKAFNDARRSSNLVVNNPMPIESSNGNYKEVRVIVEADDATRVMMGGGNNLQYRYLHVAKATKNSSWKVVSIKSGP